MSLIQRIYVAIIVLPIILCIGMFAISAAVNGVDEAVDLAISTPRNLFCSIVPFCDAPNEETEVIDEELLWTRIHERALLDVGKFEQRRVWRAERSTFVVTHSMRMRATLNVTIGVNLDNTGPDDIIVDEADKTITVTLSQAQPVECFLDNIEYYDRSCIGVCGDLEDDLVDDALDSWRDNEELQIELEAAYLRATREVTALIEPLAEDYTITFVQNPEAPPPITSGSCYSN